MDITTIRKHTRICSKTGIEHIYIRNIPFIVEDGLYYNKHKLNSILHRTNDTVYIEFNDIDQLCKIIGTLNFYILNQIYHFDPMITTDIKSTLLFYNKPLNELHILIEAIVDVYNGQFSNCSYTYYIRLENKCSIDIYLNWVNGYLIEIYHSSNLYKEEFKAFVSDFSKLID